MNGRLVLTIELENSLNIHNFLMIDEKDKDSVVNIDIFDNNVFKQKIKANNFVVVVLYGTNNIELFLSNLFPVLINNNPHIKFNNVIGHKYYNMLPNIVKKITATPNRTYASDIGMYKNREGEKLINFCYLPNSIVYLDNKNNKVQNLPNKILKISSVALFLKQEKRTKLPIKLNIKYTKKGIYTTKQKISDRFDIN
jgi:hypothetical protein